MIEKQKQDHHFSIIMSDALYQAVTRASQESHRSRGNWVKEQIFHGLKRQGVIKKDTDDLL